MAMDKKGEMCDTCRGGMGCGCGHCDYHMMGRRHGLARALLCFAILAFVFWIGLALGELKAYIWEGRYDIYYGMYPSADRTYVMPRIMGVTPAGYATPSPSPSPSGKK